MLSVEKMTGSNKKNTSDRATPTFSVIDKVYRNKFPNKNKFDPFPYQVHNFD